MTKQELKEKLLGQFDQMLVEKLPLHILSVIDENVTSVLDGTTIINGRKAETEEEIMHALNYGLIERLAVYQRIIAAAKKFSKDGVNVTIDYRETSLNV